MLTGLLILFAILKGKDLVFGFFEQPNEADKKFGWMVDMINHAVSIALAIIVIILK